MRRAAGQIDVWDLPVRAFHWGLVAAFATAFLTAGVYGRLHEAAGYSVLALVVFRVAWGFLGSRHARFADFVRPPGEVLAFLRRELAGRGERHMGHNPAGGAMILALLGLCLALGVTGWLQLTPAWFGDKRLTTLHTWLAYATVALVPLHVLGVVVASLIHRENLVTAMLTGRKRQEPGYVATPEEQHDRLADRLRATNVFALIAILIVAAQLLWPQVSAQLETNARRAKIAARVEAERQAKAAGAAGLASARPALAAAAATAARAGQVAAATDAPPDAAGSPEASMVTAAALGDGAQDLGTEGSGEAPLLASGAGASGAQAPVTVAMAGLREADAAAALAARLAGLAPDKMPAGASEATAEDEAAVVVEDQSAIAGPAPAPARRRLGRSQARTASKVAGSTAARTAARQAKSAKAKRASPVTVAETIAPKPAKRIAAKARRSVAALPQSAVAFTKPSPPAQGRKAVTVRRLKPRLVSQVLARDGRSRSAASASGRSSGSSGSGGKGKGSGSNSGSGGSGSNSGSGGSGSGSGSNSGSGGSGGSGSGGSG